MTGIRPPMTAVAGAIATTVLLASCTSGGSGTTTTTRNPPTPTQSTTAPSPTPTTPTTSSSVERETADRAAVEKAWQHYWDVYLALEAKYPSSQWTKLVGAIAVDPIRSQILVQAAKYRVEKIEAFGYVVIRPSWPQPIAGRTTAVMADCQDGTHAGSRYVTTGKQKTVGEARTSIRATFVMGRDHVWRVKQIAYLGTPC